MRMMTQLTRAILARPHCSVKTKATSIRVSIYQSEACTLLFLTGILLCKGHA